MARVYVTYCVPVASAGLTTASVPLVPNPGPQDAEATHMGGNRNCDDASTSYGDLVGLLDTIPGALYSVTPFRAWTNQVNWIGWLATNGLQPQVLTP